MISGVEQDRAGFVWIATSGGLARYDGRTVKVFRKRIGDTTSLANNQITQLERTATGTLLVVSGGGENFQLFDPATERFTTLLDQRTLLCKKIRLSDGHLSADGRHLWGVLEGVHLIDYDLRQKTMRVYSIPAMVGGTMELQHFVLTPDHYLYSQHAKGLFQLNTRTGHKRLIPFPFAKLLGKREADCWSLNRQQVALAPNGQIAIFGLRVIVLYDPARDQFKTIPIPGDETAAEAPRAATPGAESKFITYAMKTLADNRLYVGYLNRLYRLDTNGRLVQLANSPSIGEKITPWCLDRSGVLWCGTRPGGLTGLDLNAQPFTFLPKRKSFNQDLLEQDLGVALPDGFENWEVANWPRYTIRAGQPGYLTDPSRIYRHTPGNSTLAELRGLRSTRGADCCKLCLKVTRQGRIWFYNNYRGLVEATPPADSGRLYPNSQLPLTQPTPAYDAGDIEPMGRSVWVASQYGLGLFRYDIRRQRFDKPLINDPNSTNSLPHNSLNCLATDPTDSTVLWIGTAGGGLCRLATRTMTFRRLGEAEGFPDGSIQSIETDRAGTLWCATNRGLVRVNPNTLTWRHFTTDDGLADNVFPEASSARLPDGRLVFGTTNGRVVFDPAAVRERAYEPPIVLSALAVNNKPVEVGQPDSPLPTSLNQLRELVLTHTQNFLTFTFAGLDYAKPAKLTYRHQLTGVDDDWVVIGTQNTANYTQLAPGRYVFRVNCTTADGRWSSHIRELAVRIEPPFWATWWAYTLYALAIGGVGWGVIRLRIGQLRQRQQIAMRQQEADQLRAVDEAKTRFFSNVTHEFRTPLTLILSPAEKLLNDGTLDEPTRHTVGTIRQNAGRLLSLINQLLDLSKLESQSMNVVLARGDGLAFLAQLMASFGPMAANRGIRLDVTVAGVPSDSPREDWLFDADKWTTIISNVLSNALKFTPVGGQVAVTVEPPLFAGTASGTLLLRVADTGSGIPTVHLPHIFDRFYQVDGSHTRAYEGTGIGLALVKEVTHLLGGSIDVESRTEPPTGTTFTLRLPVKPGTPGLTTDLPTLTVQPWLTAEWTQPDAAHRPAVVGQATPNADLPLVLVVEDNDELRAFIAGELTGLYRVLTAADGQEGWDSCQRELPDIVISDVMMPRMDGYQLTQHIKTAVVTNHVAVVLLTAKAAHQSRMAGLQQGADEYLTKPFHVDELKVRLQNLLTRKANLRAYLHRQLASADTPTDEPVTDPFVTQLHQTIEARLGDPTFGVDDLAEAVAMSRRTLHRKLTTTTDLTANEFIRHYRLQRAVYLLRTGLPVAETAYRVGFESPAYFTKVFKQTYQQTPTAFVENGVA